MKEELDNPSVDVEKLLREKSWAQLTNEEKSAISDAFSGEEEYEQMRSMVHQLRSASGILDEDLVPSKHVRADLLAAFDDEQRRKRVIWWNSLGFWFRDRLRFDIPAVRYAFAGVILILGIVSVFRLVNTNNLPENNTIVKNEPAQTVPLAPNENNAIVVPVPELPAPSENDVPVIVQNGNNDQSPKTNLQKDPSEATPKVIPNNPNPVVDVNQRQAQQDSIGRIAIANIVPIDSNALPIVVLTNNAVDACCTGATQVLLASPANTNAIYNWSPTSMGNVTSGVVFVNGGTVGLPPTSRALVEDEHVINVFFALR